MPAPNAPPPTSPPADPPTPPETLSAEDIRALVTEQVRVAVGDLGKVVAPIVNAAVTNHLKRLPPPPPPDAPPPPDGAKGKDPALAKLEEELAKIKDAHADAEKRAQETARRSAETEARRQLGEQLAAKGLTGAKARAVIADLSASGAFRLDDEGRPVLSVTRARVKGSKAAALDHTDLGEAVADWVQTDEAKEFLPAPQAGTAAGRPGVARQPLGHAPPKLTAKQIEDSEEAAVAAAAAALDS